MDLLRGTLISILCILFISSMAHGAEKITGAFGIQFGQNFMPRDAISTSQLLNDGTPFYEFRPQKPFDTFSKYYVMITPVTNKVYSIWGIGGVKNDSDCKNQRAVIIELIENKYGKSERKSNLENFLDVKVVSQGERYVMVKCGSFRDDKIEARYYDKKLEALAEKERIKTEAKKKNSSGL